MPIHFHNGDLEQLKQLVNTTWDGDLISKDSTKRLREKCLVTSWNGFNVITQNGLKMLCDLGQIHY